MTERKTAACFCTHDDAWYLAESIASVREGGDLFAFVSRVPWHDQPGDWEACAKIARQAGAKVVVGEWKSELGYPSKKGTTMPDPGRRSRKAAKGERHAALPNEERKR